ncbi:hypothetical protein ISN76_19110 [Dyella halodurans]|uniref:Uncharacterized protein n=1 Tax=Dyella halodurans TaxID=1920171 RepID=A0ABV9C013_9GAMM|nr:hypothetical protein [Dyella halodurans]
MSLMIGPYAKRRKLALKGKMNLGPIAITAIVTLAISYLSSIFFDVVAGSTLASEIGAYGVNHVPAIWKSVGISPYPEKCSFVMTIQWLLFLLYAALLFIGYWPVAPTIRVAIRRSASLRPVPHAFLRLAVFLIVAFAFILGDFSVIHFPTFFNGDMITDDSSHSVLSLSRLIANSSTMPLISWFVVFASVFIYWGAFYVLVNFKLLVGQDD